MPETYETIAKVLKAQEWIYDIDALKQARPDDSVTITSQGFNQAEGFKNAEAFREAYIKVYPDQTDQQCDVVVSSDHGFSLTLLKSEIMEFLPSLAAALKPVPVAAQIPEPSLTSRDENAPAAPALVLEPMVKPPNDNRDLVIRLKAQLAEKTRALGELRDDKTDLNRELAVRAERIARLEDEVKQLKEAKKAARIETNHQVINPVAEHKWFSFGKGTDAIAVCSDRKDALILIDALQAMGILTAEINPINQLPSSQPDKPDYKTSEDELPHVEVQVRDDDLRALRKFIHAHRQDQKEVVTDNIDPSLKTAPLTEEEKAHNMTRLRINELIKLHDSKLTQLTHARMAEGTLLNQMPEAHNREQRQVQKGFKKGHAQTLTAPAHIEKELAQIERELRKRCETNPYYLIKYPDIPKILHLRQDEEGKLGGFSERVTRKTGLRSGIG